MSLVTWASGKQLKLHRLFLSTALPLSSFASPLRFLVSFLQKNSKLWQTEISCKGRIYHGADWRGARQWTCLSWLGFRYRRLWWSARLQQAWNQVGMNAFPAQGKCAPPKGLFSKEHPWERRGPVWMSEEQGISDMNFGLRET